MNSNPEVRCLDWWNDSVSHNASECLCFNSTLTDLSIQSTEKEKMPTSSCHFWRPRRQRSRCLRSLITCARQDTFDAFCHLRKHLIWILYKISCIQWWSTKVCIVLNRTPKEVLCVIRGILRAFDWTCSRITKHKPVKQNNCISTRPQLYSAIHRINHNPTGKC